MPLAAAVVAGLAIAACQPRPAQDIAIAQPDIVQPGAAVPARQDRRAGPFVSAANPLAAEAGMAVLRRGGSAVDAAVAIQAVLGLVEPQSSGLGGGAFLLHYDARTRLVRAYDGRESAPAATRPDIFIENGQPLGFREAVLSGRSTGVPGAVAMLARAHDDHGTLEWASLFGDAERLATEGFIVSPRLAGMINGQAPQAGTDDARAYFSRADGARLQAGDLLRNEAYAHSLRLIARHGADGLLRGPLAEAIVASAARAPRPGALTMADLAAYEPRVGEAVCRPWRVYVVCVPPPPSSGVALLQLLLMAEQVEALRDGPDSDMAWIAFGRLQRLMYADRDAFVGDPAFVRVPVTGLLSRDYVRERSLLWRDAALPEAGDPPPDHHSEAHASRGRDTTVEARGTSHFVVVDAAGNAVSMTTTVESIFGSGRMAGGFFLNNQLTDFAFTPTDAQGRPLANAPAPGKRPRSSMSPVIVLDAEGRLVGLMGSPGGNAILAYNAKALIGTLMWGLSMQEAIDLPNLVVRGASVGADTGQFPPARRAALAQAGMALRDNTAENSGLHGGLWRDGRWDGGADRRREGVALYR
ncbi:MAG: gamma-glutamyltransferase family protein [Brevundimonas sp.]|uniref:gamma-glutamyltransferase family protein n=1 Tax=Brevundimonas sp. TaxID=1871086 RepID=UPI00391BBF1D